jgi:ABC-2 type transport system ATP-binding protein
MPDAPAIYLRNVTKTFGRTTAVRGLDLSVPRGGLYGVIGPNGAGKTTSIRMIMAIFLPDSGDVSILGHASALEARDRIGYLPEERGVYRKMRVGAFLTYMGRLKGVADAVLAARVPRLLERVGLAGTERQRCEALSKGMLQKVQILAAILHQPDLLILDEPFSGLDPVNTRLLREVIEEEHRRGATILFSTHVMTQAEEVCDHVVMIHEGRKVLDEPLTAIRRQFDPRTVIFEPLDTAADVSALGALAEVERIDRVDGACELLLVEGSEPAAAIRRIAAAVPAARIELARPRLEDVFIRIVAGSGAAGGRERRLRDELRDAAAPGVAP